MVSSAAVVIRHADLDRDIGVERPATFPLIQTRPLGQGTVERGRAAANIANGVIFLAPEHLGTRPG
jgi:hypothetical protein